MVQQASSEQVAKRVTEGACLEHAVGSWMACHSPARRPPSGHTWSSGREWMGRRTSKVMSGGIGQGTQFKQSASRATTGTERLDRAVGGKQGDASNG